MSFTHPDWISRLADEGLDTFDSWWALESDTVEPVNRRGGWSNVITHTLADGTLLFVKRQENFYPQNFYHKLCRRLTFQLECENHQRLVQAGVPSFDLVYFATQQEKGNKRAVFVSKALSGFTSMKDLMLYWDEHGWPPRATRRRLLKPIAAVVRKMHRAGMLHNALNGRHVFLNIPITSDGPSIPEKIQPALIDLEGVKKLSPNSNLGIMRDLLSFNRRLMLWPNRDRLWFFKQYIGHEKLTQDDKKIIRRLLRRIAELNARP